MKKTYNSGIAVTDDRGNKFFYLMNGHGDVANLIDKDGNIVQVYSYDAFGGLVGGDKSNGYQYVGAGSVFSDVDAGLQYMWNRWYDPQLGRFISRDPIGFAGGLNLYGYVGNNPLRFTDIFGLCPTNTPTPSPSPTTTLMPTLTSTPDMNPEIATYPGFYFVTGPGPDLGSPAIELGQGFHQLYPGLAIIAEASGYVSNIVLNIKGREKRKNSSPPAKGYLCK